MEEYYTTYPEERILIDASEKKFSGYTKVLNPNCRDKVKKMEGERLKHDDRMNSLLALLKEGGYDVTVNRMKYPFYLEHSEECFRTVPKFLERVVTIFVHEGCLLYRLF